MDYVTRDGKWAAVPFGSKFMIIHEGQQGQVFKSLDAAKAFIAQQVKSSTKVSAPKNRKKSKNQSQGTLAPHLK